MNEDNIKIINTSYHKKITDNHLAQVNFTAVIPSSLYTSYVDKTSYDKRNLGRIRFMEKCGTDIYTQVDDSQVMVFGRVSHGYGYDISQDIYNSIMDSKGAK